MKYVKIASLRKKVELTKGLVRSFKSIIKKLIKEYKKELKQGGNKIRKKDIKNWEAVLKALEDSKYKIAYNKWNKMDTEPSEGVWKINKKISTQFNNALYDFVNK